MRASLCCCLVLTLLVPIARGQEKEKENEPELGPLEKRTLTIDPGCHTATIRRVFFNPDDSDQLITLADDATIRLWSVATRRTLKVIHPPGRPYFHAATMSRDGKRLAFPSLTVEDGKDKHVICVLSLPDGRLEMKPLRGHAAQIRALAFTPDGQRLASWALPKEGVQISDLTGKAKPDVILKGKAFFCVTFSPDGKRLAAAGTGFVVLHDLGSGQSVEVQELPKTKIGAVAWSPDGKTVAASTYLGSEIHFFDDQGKRLRSTKYPGFGEDLRFSPDSKTVLVVGRMSSNFHQAALVDVATGNVQHKLVRKRKKGEPIDMGSTSGAFSSDGKLVATAGWAVNEAAQIIVWQSSDGSEFKKVDTSLWFAGGANSLHPTWSKDGQSVCWISAASGKATGFLPGKTATFHLKELQFMKSLTADQRFERAVGDPDDATYKQGDLALKKTNYRQFELTKNGTSVIKLDGGDATFIGPGRVALNRGRHIHIVDALTGKEISRCEGRADSYGRGLHPDPNGQFLMRLNNNQTMTIWNVKQAAPLLTLYRKGEDWIIWTEEGYYAATPGGERLISWKIDNGIDKMPSVYPASRFSKQLLRPDVIKLVLEKGSVAAALKAANAVEKIETRDVKVESLLPPRVVLTVDESQKPLYKLKISAEASAKEQPIIALGLKLDGKVVLNDKLTAEFPGGKHKVENIEWTINLPDGEHQLNVMARSPDAIGFSPSRRVKHVDAKNLPDLHVLAVGINQYRDGSLDLKFPVPDAKAIAATFKKQCEGDPFRAVKTNLLLDKQATAKSIAAELQRMRKEAQPQDLVVVFFGCHGVMHKKEYYLLTHEADTEKLDQTCLSGTALRKELKEYKCQVLLMLDACHSNGFGAGKKLTKLGLKPATDDAARDLADDDNGIAVMAAAMAHEKAEGVGGYGLFTRAILDVLEKKPGVPYNRHNQRLYLHHLQSYVFDEVSIRSEQRQHPFLTLPTIVESFVIR